MSVTRRESVTFSCGIGSAAETGRSAPSSMFTYDSSMCGHRDFQLKSLLLLILCNSNSCDTEAYMLLKPDSSFNSLLHIHFVMFWMELFQYELMPT